MSESAAGPTILSLDSVHAGDIVQIEAIPFDELRSYCRAVGLSVGDTVRCRAGSPAWLLLATPAGRTVSLERDRARFIRVHPSISGW